MSENSNWHKSAKQKMYPLPPIWTHALCMQLALHAHLFSGTSSSRPFQSLASVRKPSTEVTVALILIVLRCSSTCLVNLPKKISSVPWQDSWGTSLTSSPTQCLLKETQWMAFLAGRGEVGAAHEGFAPSELQRKSRKRCTSSTILRSHFPS